ncbi:MAG: hypothetical protein SFV18_20165 [Bryobacteraceae bacterium]|nr:hypothetical protein [Bryobacteraceae bacterium]
MVPVKTDVFDGGGFRAIRLPEQIDLGVGEVLIETRGDEVVIRRGGKTIGDVLREVGFEPSEDFMKEGRPDQGVVEVRKYWFED